MQNTDVAFARGIRRVLLALSLVAAIASAAHAQIDPRTALLEQAGWQALDAGQPHQAAEDFRNALAADPLNARLHLGAGAAAYAERRDQDARAELERALNLSPNLTEARSLLARVQYRLGDRRAAIASLDLIEPTAADAAALRAMRDRWQREAELHDSMPQIVGAEFTVSFNGPTDQALAEEALASLDRAYWRIGTTLSTFPVQPISVVLYTTQQFSDITRAPAWAAGAYDGIIRVPIRGALEKRAELDRVLAHEFTHALVHDLAPRGVPTWLNEGLATALEAEDLSWAERDVAAVPTQIPLGALTSGFAGMNGRTAQLAYATSALVARRLLAVDNASAVVNLLRDLGAGSDFDPAFNRRFHRSLRDFEDLK